MQGKSHARLQQTDRGSEPLRPQQFESETTLFPEMFDDLAGEALTELSAPKQRLQLAQQRLGSSEGQVSLQATLALSLEFWLQVKVFGGLSRVKSYRNLQI